MSTWHVSDAVLSRYAAGDATLAAPDAWSAETHLERCADCRARLATAADPRVGALVSSVRAGLDAALATAPARPRGRRAIAARLVRGRRAIGPRPWPPAGARVSRLAGSRRPIGSRPSPLADARRPSGSLPSPPAAPRHKIGPLLSPFAGPRRPIGPLTSPLLACLAVLLAAALLDLAAGAGTPSLVVLAAPLLPLVGVAASWSRVIDPAFELVAATPAAGLSLLLRRTLMVLAIVVPCTFAAEALTGAPSAAAWLLPCLALTAAALALGAVMRLDRACLLLAGAWTAGVVVPALAAQAMPFVLDSGWLPAWAAVAVVAAAVIARRKEDYRWAQR